MKQKKHKIKMPAGKTHIPAGFARSPEGTVAYITEFNRLNGLKPVPYIWRGRVQL